MPQYSTPIEEIDESIIRPIIISVTADLLERMDLPTNINFLFKGDSAQQYYKNSTIQERIKNTESNIRYIGDTYMYLESSVEDTEQLLLSTVVYRPEEMPIFNDPRLSVVLRPAVVNKKVELTFTFTGTEKELERWRSTLKRKVSQGNLGLTHMVTYHYPIPQHYMYLLTAIFNLRQTVEPYPNETLGGWFKENFRKPFTVITNQIGNGSLFAVQEKQIPIQGWFDFGTNPPKPDKDNDVSRYSLSFNYSFYFDCPESIIFKTPLVIHNQHLPYEFINTTKPLEIELIERYGSISQNLLEKYRWSSEKTRPVLPVGITGLPIPWYDDWMEFFTPKWYSSWIRILIQVDQTNPHFVVNLKELGSWEINPLALTYMYNTREYLSKPYDSLFSLTLWRWGELERMDDLYIDEDMNVFTKTPMQPRELYHLMLSINYDPTTLTDKGIEDLLKHACFMKHYLSILAPELRIKYKWDLDKCAADPNSDKPFTKDDWKKIVDDFDKNGKPFTNDIDTVFWYLVGTFAIIAHRQENENE